MPFESPPQPPLIYNGPTLDDDLLKFRNMIEQCNKYISDDINHLSGKIASLNIEVINLKDTLYKIQSILKANDKMIDHKLVLIKEEIDSLNKNLHRRGPPSVPTSLLRKHGIL